VLRNGHRACEVRFAVICAAAVTAAIALDVAAGELPQQARVAFERDDAAGQLWVLIEGRKAFCYQYGSDLDLVHFYPINSPSGRSMTVQQTEPYPHHRSFWFADRVALRGGRPVATYSALYTGVKRQDQAGRTIYVAPFKDGIRHVRFGPQRLEGDTGWVEMYLVWYMDYDRPVLDEYRQVRVKSLGNGEYFIDIVFWVKARYSDVRFLSDAVHYAWPYIRMNSDFAVPGGAKISTSHGPPPKARVNNFICRWVDYSNTTGGKNAGLAMFSHPSNPGPHGWLIRDYGTFGPRRVAERNGKPFVLGKGKSLKQRVGVLVHRGDVTVGRVQERYERYARGDL